jgi:uncharacterized glyoxalase superfamily protein PhnB
MQKENTMDPSPILELNAFVPAKDFELSKRFYSDVGFLLAWANDDIAKFQVGSFSFLLQKFHVQQHSENFMMSLTVDDADLWWQRFEQVGLREKYPKIMLRPPAMQPWGIRVLYVSDPTGVLWHIADRKDA